MQFASPLLRGVLIKRYKRFLADVTLENGEVVTAHCANSGSMLSVDQPGSEVWLSRASNPKRKLGYTWELIRVGENLVGINTNLPNALVAEAIGSGTMTELAGYATLRREVKYGQNSRIDILLDSPGRPQCFVEVKNVSLKRDPEPGGLLEFPDAVTARGQKHLMELADMVQMGHRAVMVYLAQRSDGGRFTIAHDIDTKYAQALRLAVAAGVEAVCYLCSVSTEGIRVERPVPVNMPSAHGYG